jgi:WD40 repeat protein
MQILKGHEGGVHALAFSPTGDAIASAGKDGSVRVWDPWGDCFELGPALAPAHALAFSSDGRYLVTGKGGGGVELWDLAARQMKSSRPSTGRIVNGLAFGPDDAAVAFGLGDPLRLSKQAPGVYLWDWRQDKCRALPVDVASSVPIRALASLAERRLLAWVTESRSIVVWNLVQADRITFNLKSPCRTIALAPNGKTLAAAIDWKTVLFDLERKQERSTLAGHKGVVRAMAYSPDGRRLMTGGWDQLIKFWDADSGREWASFEWPLGRIHCVAFAADGLRAAAAGEAGSIVVWDLDA